MRRPPRPPTPPPRRPGGCGMPRTSASYGRPSSAGGLRPNAAALDSRALARELGHARDLPELLRLHQRHGDRFDLSNLSVFWSSFKKLSLGFKKRSLGKLSNLGGLGGHSDRLAPVCAQTVRMLPSLNARAVATVAHTLANAGLVGVGPWQRLWAVLPEAVIRSLGDSMPQGLSNTAWAFAFAGQASVELFNAISAEVVCRRLGGFTEQDLSNTAWAFATAGHASMELFNAISAEAVRRGLGDFNERDLSHTAWAFATVGHASVELFNGISAEVVRRRLGSFNEQDLSNTVWAFAKAGQTLPELFSAISAEVVRRQLGGFREIALSSTAWAFATAGHASAELFKAIAAEAVRRGLGGFNEQNLSNTAWAFAVLNPPSVAELFGPATFTTRCAHLETSFSRKSLAQLHQWSLWRKERGARWPALPRSLQQACRDAFVTQGEKSSQFQRNVVEEIRSRGANVQEEHRCEISGYSIDALVTLNDGRQIAVEVDGPLHFWGHSRQPTGATLLKQRQLRHFGWRLESVPFWRWNHTKELHWLPIMS